MSKLKRIIFSLLATLGLAVPFAMPVAVHGQSIDENLKCGANLSFSEAATQDCEAQNTVDAGERVDSIVTSVVNVLSLIVGVAAVIMVMVGGMRYITSNGDSGQVGNAKNTILYAIVGLIVVALAQIIVRFVVKRATEPVTP